MSDRPRPDPTQAPRSVIAGVLAALAPLFAAAYALVMLVVLNDGASGLLERLTEAGPLGVLVLACAPLSGLLLAVLLFLVAWRGTKIPSAVLLGAGAVPWLLGLVGTMLGMVRVTGAIGFADAGSRSLLALVGTGEASTSSAMGAWCSGALFCSIGLGLAIGARARKGPGRKALAAVVALPVLGVIGFTLAYVRQVHDLFLLVPSCLVVLVATALAASAIGRDGASGSQASAAALACWVGLVATLLAIVTFGVGRGYVGLGAADPASRGMFLGISLGTIIIGARMLLVVGGCVGLSAAAIAALSFVRARPTTGRVVAAVAAMLIALGVVGVDRLVFASSESDTVALLALPWSDEADFTPTRAAGDHGEEPHALVTIDRVVPFEGEPVPLSDVAGLRAAFETLRTGRSPTWRGRELEEWAPQEEEEEEIPEWLQEEEAAGARPTADGYFAPRGDAPPALTVRPDHQLALALDARLGSAALRHLLTVLNAAEIDRVTLVSQAPAGFDEEARARLEAAPLIESFLTGGMSSSSIVLERAVPDGYADRDPMLWHAEVSGEVLRIAPRVDADVDRVQLPGSGRFEIPLRRRDLDPPLPTLGNAIVYLTLGAQVTPAQLAGAANIVNEMEARAVVVLGEVPGHPERALVREAPRGLDASAPILDGRERTISGSVLVGSLEDESGEGLFDAEIVTRTIRMRIRAIQACYERELRHNPTLAGRIVVRFTVAPQGSVAGVMATQNTTGSPEVASCVVATVGRLRFNPGPEGGSVTFAYPFVFAPSQ